MRSARRWGCVVLLVTLAASCDSTPPLQQETQTAAFRILAPGAEVEQVDVWDTFEDNDGDLQPDGPVFLYCNGIGEDIQPISVPWPFSIRVSVVRNGETVRSEVTSSNALDPSYNLAQYDTSVVNNASPSKPPRFTGPTNDVTVDDDGTLRTFRFRNARRLTTVNRDVVYNLLARNPLCQVLNDDPDEANCSFLNGVCSQGDPGQATIDGLAQPFTMELGKGDSVRVEVRRSLSGPPLLGSLITGQPSLNGAMFVNGNRVNVEGDSTSSNASGDGFVFWYTSR